MATQKQPTNSDIIAKIDTMNTRVTSLEDWRRGEEIARKAVDEYKRKEQEDRIAKAQLSRDKEWTEVGKKALVVLGVVLLILYAYANSKGFSL